MQRNTHVTSTFLLWGNCLVTLCTQASVYQSWLNLSGASDICLYLGHQCACQTNSSLKKRERNAMVLKWVKIHSNAFYWMQG